tara:strand:+ start:17654 stop:20029 length:2376 start_codon:yes stop_codon:yes gene_type:complete
MAALKVRSFLPTTVQGSPRVDPIAGLTTSVNRLGTVVEDLGKILTGMHQDKMDLLNQQQRTANFGRDRSRENRLEQDVEKGVKKDKSLQKTSKKSKGWLDAFLEPFIWIAEKAITFFMLDWLADPKNEQFLRTTLPIIGGWLKTAWDIGTASVNMIMEAFSEDSLLMGALKLVGGIGGLWLVGRILRPWKIASDIGKLMRLVSGNRKNTAPKPQSPQQIRAATAAQRNRNASIAAKERFRKRYGDAAYNRRFGPSKLQRVKQGLGSNIRKGLTNSKVMAGGAGLISFGTRLAQGDSVQKAAGGGIGATIGSMALTALITPILGPFAPLVGSVLGGFLGDKVGAFIGEAITPILKPMKTLFMEVLLPIITSYFEPLLPPVQELFNELGPILQMIADFCKPLIDGAVQEIAKFLGGNIAKAVNGLMWLIKFGANAVSGIVEGTGRVLRKIDFMGLFKDDVVKAEEKLRGAVNDVESAKALIAKREAIVKEKGPNHKDWFDNTTAAQDVQDARKQYEAAVALVEVRKKELAKAKSEQEAKATQAMAEEQARIDAQSKDDSGGGDGRIPISASGVTAAAKKVIGKYQGVSNMCAMSVRAYLKAAGHPKWDTIATKTGNLDPDGTQFIGPTFAASFAGTDLGQHIMDKSKLKPGDILLYRDTITGFTPGAVTHVGVMGENGMQYDHNSRNGFHARSLSSVLTWAKWGGGIRLKGMPSQDSPADMVATKVDPSSDLNNRKTELISRSESESTTQLQNESGADPKVILQPIIKPAVVTASSGGGGATLVPGSVSTSVS